MKKRIRNFKNNSKGNFVDFLVYIVVHKSKMAEKIFLILSIFSLCFLPLIGTNYDLTKYLPDWAPTKQGIDLMEQEFGYPGSAQIMIKNVTPYEAKLYKERIEDIEGVDSVSWIDNAGQIFIGDDFFSSQDLDDYYKNECALFSVQFVKGDSDPLTYSALEEIQTVLGENCCLTGPSVDNNSLGQSLNAEIPKIMGLALVVIILILTLTTNSWLEPYLFLFTMGIGILLNMGSNIIFGEISFISASVAALLQLAVSMDYSIFLLHTFTEEKQKSNDITLAMSNAVKKSFSSVISSSFTTVIGFTALALMDFKIGADMGFVLAKGILCAMLVVLFFMPAVILRTNKLLEKTAHKPFFTNQILTSMSNGLFKFRYIMTVFLMLIIIPCCIGQGMNEFNYGTGALAGGEGSKTYEDAQEIKAVFGENNMMLVMVPNTNAVMEKRLSDELDELPFVKNVASLSGILPAGISEDFLPAGIVSELHTDRYARIIVMIDSEVESDYSYQCVNTIKEITLRYYPEDCYFIGSTSATMDMENIITADYGRVNMLSILGVALVILISFKSPIIMLLTVLPIEMAVMINMFIPYLMGNELVFLGYLMVSSMQLGATVDYAILMCNHYITIRETETDKKTACIKTIKKSILSIMTSGFVLTIVGYTLSGMCSIKAIADMGMLVGRGALISMAIVLTFLPFLLFIFDKQIMSDRKRMIALETKIGDKIKNKRKSVKKCISIFSCTFLLASIVSVEIYAKAPECIVDETAYVTYDYYGVNPEIDIVKAYEPNGKTSFKDYGIYESIKNMTTLDKGTLEADGVTWNISEEAANQRFYFEVTPKETSTYLPFLIDVAYTLNGIPTKAEDLAGASGLVGIDVNVKPNPQADIYYKNNFALVASMIADTDSGDSISAPGAQFQSLGTYQTAIFIALPGGEEAFHFDISTDCFETSGVTFMMMPLTLSKLDDIQEVNEHKDNIEDASEAMSETMDDMLDLMSGMTGSIKQTEDGLNTLNSARETIDGSNDSINTCIDQVRLSVQNMEAGLNNFAAVTDNGKLVTHIHGMSAGLLSMTDTIESMSEKLEKVCDSMERMNKTMGSIMDTVKSQQSESNASDDANQTNSIQTLSEELASETQELNETLQSFTDEERGLLEQQTSSIVNTIINDDGDEDVSEDESNDDEDTTEGKMVPYSLTNNSSDTSTNDENSNANNSSEDDYTSKIALEAGAAALTEAERMTRSFDKIIDDTEELTEQLNSMAYNLEAMGGDVAEILKETTMTLSNASNLLGTLDEMVGNVDATLDAAHNDLNNGMDLTLSGMATLMNQLAENLKKIDNIKENKKIITDVIEDEWNRIEDDLGILDIDSQAIKHSFTSDKNIEPRSLQIIARTQEIEIPDADNSYSSTEVSEDIGIWGRFKAVLVKMLSYLINIFS